MKIPAKIDGFPQFDIIDRDHVRTLVDGEPEVFSRKHRYSQMRGSGLAYFGPVVGDWRMISAIHGDVTELFATLDREIERINA